MTLTATNTAGSNTITRTGYITVSKSDSAPVGKFCCKCDFGDSASVRPVCGLFHELPDIVGLVVWRWRFFDRAEPVPYLHKCRTYTVTLTATSGAGSNTLSESGYITASKVAALPVASFAATETSGTAPMTVQFVDSSTNTPTSWVWSFGDGGSSTLQNPSHTYTSAGTYTVTLTATNAGRQQHRYRDRLYQCRSHHPRRFLYGKLYLGLSRLRSISRIHQRILPLNGTGPLGMATPSLTRM